MRVSANTIFALLMLAFVALIVVTSIGYPVKGRFGPLVIGIPAIILQIFVLIRENIRRPEQRNSQVKNSAEIKKDRRKYYQVTAWMGGLVVFVYLFGMLFVFPLFVLAYLKLNHQSWLLSILLAVSTFVVLYGVCELALKADLYRGIFL